jgi:hypothetical protein
MPAPLGTGFVPQSPEVTAQQIAGAQALAQAQQALGQIPGQAQPGSPMGEGQPQASAQGQPMGEASQDGPPMDSEGSPLASKSGSRQKGSPMENQDQPPGDLQVDKSSEGEGKGELDKQDSDAAKRKYEEEPWFAKLPPSLRTAIQSKARNKAPRGYEERLKRYFESID